MSAAMLEVRRLTKTYQSAGKPLTVLSDVDLRVVKDTDEEWWQRKSTVSGGPGCRGWTVRSRWSRRLRQFAWAHRAPGDKPPPYYGFWLPGRPEQR